jgi:hypothetical protein
MAAGEHGTIGYADFEDLLTQLHGLGFSLPNKLVRDVAHAAHGIELATAAWASGDTYQASTSASAYVCFAAASTSGSLGTSSKHRHIAARVLICRTFKSLAFQRWIFSTNS